MTVLVAYATKHGSTGEVATRIADRLRAAGVEVTCCPVKEVTSLDRCDTVILGSGVYVGSWVKGAAAFVDRFASENRVFGGVVDRSKLSLVERGVLKALKVPDGDYRDNAEIDAWTDQIAAQL